MAHEKLKETTEERAEVQLVSSRLQEELYDEICQRSIILQYTLYNEFSG